jgi:hypothetical protein
MNRKREREAASATSNVVDTTGDHDFAPSSPSNREPALKAAKIDEESSPSTSTNGMK